MKNTPCILLITAFLANTLGPLPITEAQEFHLPAPGVMVHLSPPLDPPMLKGIKVHPDDPFKFDFILDQGDGIATSEADPSSHQEYVRAEASKLVRYFLASLTIPEKDLWVNLSPYEKQRIVPQNFGLTEMGRDLLAEDYILKQITASLIYPEGETGRKFWKRVYEEAAKKFGTTNIPVNTFNKVWIVPEKAVVYENARAGTAYVVESKLKVMLEQDYLAMSKNVMSTRGHVPEGYVSPSPLPSDVGLNAKATQRESLNALGSQIVREIVIPELAKEINEDKNFSRLRQVYNSLILATWYKRKIRDSILEQVYAGKNKVKGLSSPNALSRDPSKGDIEAIYQRYLQAFKKGVFNYIKEESDPLTQQTIPRKYFSGGVDFAMGSTSMKGINGIIEISDSPSTLRKILALINPARLFEVKGTLETSAEPLTFSPVDVPTGYKALGGQGDPRLAARFQKTTGLTTVLLGPGVYSPLHDNGLTLEFMDTISSYIKKLAPGAGNNNVLRVLEIGSGTGLGSVTAFHQAKLRGFQVRLDAVDINDEAVENTKRNLGLLHEATDQDSAHVFKVSDDGSLSGLRDQYDLILFYAPDAVPREQLAGANAAIRMDQDKFKSILQNIADRLLDRRGMAIVGVQRDVIKAMVPEKLSWEASGTSEAGVYLARRSREFYRLTFKGDQAMTSGEMEHPLLDGHPFSDFVVWMNNIADATTEALPEERLDYLAGRLHVPGNDLKAQARTMARAVYAFNKQLPKDGKRNVYILRDAFGLYLADRFAGGDPSAMMVSKALVQKVSGTSIDLVVLGIINQAKSNLHLDISGPVPEQDFARFKQEFFRIFDALINDKDVGDIGRDNRFIVDKRSNLRLMTDYLSAYAVRMGIAPGSIMENGVRFVDTTMRGTFVLLMEAVAREMMHKAGATEADMEGKTDGRMFYSSLSQSMSFLDINSPQAARITEIFYYPVEFKGVNAEGPVVRVVPSAFKKFFFLVTALKSGLLEQAQADSAQLSGTVKRFTDDKGRFSIRSTRYELGAELGHKDVVVKPIDGDWVKGWRVYSKGENIAVYNAGKDMFSLLEVERFTDKAGRFTYGTVRYALGAGHAGKDILLKPVDEDWTNGWRVYSQGKEIAVYDADAGRFTLLEDDRHTDDKGRIQYRGVRLNLGVAYAGQDVVLRPVDEDWAKGWGVYLDERQVGAYKPGSDAAMIAPAADVEFLEGALGELLRSGGLGNIAWDSLDVKSNGFDFNIDGKLLNGAIPMAEFMVIVEKGVATFIYEPTNKEEFKKMGSERLFALLLVWANEYFRKLQENKGWHPLDLRRIKITDSGHEHSKQFFMRVSGKWKRDLAGFDETFRVDTSERGLTNFIINVSRLDWKKVRAAIKLPVSAPIDGAGAKDWVLNGSIEDIQPDIVRYRDLFKEGQPMIEEIEGLKNKVVIRLKDGRTIFIADHHNHAFSFWWLMMKEGRLKASGNRILHIDAHADARTRDRYSPEVAKAFAPDSNDLSAVDRLSEHLGIEGFIAPLAQSGFISDWHWLYNLHGGMAARMEKKASVQYDIGEGRARPEALDYDILDVDIDVLSQGFTEEESQAYLRSFAELSRKARVISIVTSPEFIDQYQAMRYLKTLVADIVAQDSNAAPDAAMTVHAASVKHVGGINMAPANMDLQIQNAGGAIKFHMDPAMFQRLQNAPGFVPVIISVKPLGDLQRFLGIVNQV